MKILLSVVISLSLISIAPLSNASAQTRAKIAA
jgi:hypothetical protein